MEIDNFLRIPGLVTKNELEFVANIIKKYYISGTVVELGTFQGRMTALLCDLCRDNVTTIDNWSMQHHGSNSYQIAKNNLADFGFYPKIITSQSDNVINGLNIAILVIDTDHVKTVIQSELESWLPLLINNGLLFLHDYKNPNWPDITTEVTRLINDGFRLLGEEGMMVALLK